MLGSTSSLLTRMSVRAFSSTTQPTLGLVGLGNMGEAVAKNLIDAGNRVVCYDVNPEAMDRVVAMGATAAASANQVASSVDTVLSILPNDRILREVVGEDGAPGMADSMRPGALHISCSTVSPNTSRDLDKRHAKLGSNYVAAPIFARPDGMAAMQGSFVVSGSQSKAVEKALAVLKQTSSGCFTFGDDPGAANLVKISGNFLIASAIESIAEASALLESNGVDRVEAVKFYSSTFLDCPIYKGYGQRVSERDHRPGGFALEWGLKDVTLARQTAHESDTPMPFLSVLVDRYLSEKAKGRADLDWSAIGLGVSENCGVDVSDAVNKSRES